MPQSSTLAGMGPITFFARVARRECARMVELPSPQRPVPTLSEPRRDTPHSRGPTVNRPTVSGPRSDTPERVRGSS